MSGAVLDFPHKAASAGVEVQQAPVPPIGQHLAGTVIAAERVRVAAETLLTVLQAAPLGGPVIRQANEALFQAVLQLDGRVNAYAALLECKGQA